MKKYNVVWLLMILLVFSSFKIKLSKACEYVGSNIGYVKSQTKKALAENDLNKARFFTYKALNAIEKSKNQMKDCGCDYAVANIEEGLKNLIAATRASSLNGSKLLLTRALENADLSLEALRNYDSESPYGNDVLAMNTAETKNAPKKAKIIEGKSLEKKIDDSLISYKESLDNIVNTVSCKEAKAFALRIYQHCEQELLKSNLSEGKKYYNLKTKDITAQALKKLEGCQ